MANIKEAFEYASQNPNSDFAKNLEQLASSGVLNEEAKKYNIDLSPFQPVEEVAKEEGEKGLKGFAVGVGKGVLSTVKGVGQLGEKIGGALLPESMTPQSVYSEEALQKNEGVGKLLTDENLEAKGTAESIGKGAEQIAEFAVPASKVSKATQASNLLTKIGTRAATSAGVASAQAGEVGEDALIAGAIETALPVVGKVVVNPVKNIVSRLFKGLGSGLSGVGTDTIEQIVANPKIAKETSKQLLTGGNKEILINNVKTIINGLFKIKKEARKAFGEGLESLQKTDIDDKIFRESTQSVLDKYGSVIKNGKRELTNIEFNDPKNVKIANELITKLQKAELDGKSLRKLVDYIENKAYKIATTDERLSFNAFVKDLASSLKSSISKSTPKLNEINKAFSTDMQLAESIEQIFGKVKFQNFKELNKVAQQLETLFSKKGLSPDYIDDFLNRIGVSPDEFKTTEAVRQISSKVTGANTKGLSIGELTQQLTSSVITPKLVRDVAILTGQTEPVIKKILENTAPTLRAAVIKGILSIGE